MQRGSWVIAGSILLAAAVVGAAILATNRGRTTEPIRDTREAPSQDEILFEAQMRAHDRSAQASLRNALVAAKTHYTDGSTYAGFDSLLAEKIEPSLVWYENTTAFGGAITINLATNDDVVLSTMSVSGQAFCIAEHDEGSVAGTYYGRMDGYDAPDATTCTGGW